MSNTKNVPTTSRFLRCCLSAKFVIVSPSHRLVRVVDKAVVQASLIHSSQAGPLANGQKLAPVVILA